MSNSVVSVKISGSGLKVTVRPCLPPESPTQANGRTTLPRSYRRVYRLPS